MKKKTAGRKAITEQQTDLYQQVTDKIIIALENGVPPWRRPWRSAQKVYGSGLPVIPDLDSCTTFPRNLSGRFSQPCSGLC